MSNFKEKLLLKKLKEIDKLFAKFDLITLYAIKQLLDKHIERKEDINV